MLELGRGEDAVACFERALASEKGDGFDIAMALAEAYRRSGDLAGARKIVTRRQKAHAEDAELHYQLGQILEEDGAHEQAIDAFRRAVELDPQHAAASFRAAYLCDLHGEDQLAVEYYEKCAALCPTYTNALLNLGVLYDDLEQYDRAVACFRRVLATDPTHSRARLFLKDALGSKDMFYDEEVERRHDRTSQVLRVPISDFELSVRSRKCLENMNIRTLGDLTRITEAELLAFKNFGETSLEEIKQILASRGLRLGMGREEGAEPLALPLSEPGLPPESDDILDRSVEEVEFSVRSRRCMLSLGIKTLRELVSKSEDDLLRCKNFGKTSVGEVKQRLEEFDLQLKPSDKETES